MRVFDLVGELVAVRPEQLDAVVVIGIVRGRDHHADIGAQRARQHGDRRRRDRPEQEHIHAGGAEARHHARSRSCSRKAACPCRSRRGGDGCRAGTTVPAAMPTLMAISGVIGNLLACPRMPSVPKYASCHSVSLQRSVPGGMHLPQIGDRAEHHICVSICYDCLAKRFRCATFGNRTSSPDRPVNTARHPARRKSAGVIPRHFDLDRACASRSTLRLRLQAAFGLAALLLAFLARAGLRHGRAARSAACRRRGRATASGRRSAA